MNSRPDLRLHIHGRIIDSLGIQMYNRPVAAISELIANAWDADATKVNVQLPGSVDDDAEIIVTDNGIGMSFDDCQNHYLSVGRNRRQDNGRSLTPNERPVLGRKGIGKFSGFGVANTLHVATTCKTTGERTVFALDLEKVRGSNFLEEGGLDVPVIEYVGSGSNQNSRQGTAIKLQSLKLKRRLNPEQFARSLSRRFIVGQQADNFQITVNERPLPDDLDGHTFQYDFPKDYAPGALPASCVIDGMDGVESLRDGNKIRWRFRFAKKPIDDDQFRGIAVFCGVKLSQKPFFFHLSGGLYGQHGQQYLTGFVRADHLDQLNEDLITTERERLTWTNEHAAVLKEWGAERVRTLLKVWKDQRAMERIRLVDQRMDSPFAARLKKLPAHERRIVEGAIKKLAAVDTLLEDRFIEFGKAILTAWEGGRLKELIDDVRQVQEMDVTELLNLLVEAQVLTTLHMAEVVRTKLDVIAGLRTRIKGGDLENKIRDFIAEHPWLLAPKWETFRRERRIANLLEDVGAELGGLPEKDGLMRIDLALSSGNQLLIIEFMRPQEKADRDHLNRFSQYCDVVRSRVASNSTLPFTHVEGLLVADKLAQSPGIQEQIARLASDGMKCSEWSTLLETAEAEWREFLNILKARSPNDSRLQNL